MLRAAILSLLAILPAQAELYCFGFLNAHPDRKELPATEVEAIQKGHLAHMDRMAAAGHLLAAGPMASAGGPRGIVLYRCQSIAQAEAWTAADPAVVNRRLSTEFYSWRGTDGFGEPLATLRKSNPQAKYQMVKLPLAVFRKTAKWTGDGPAAVLQAHGAAVRALRQAGKLRASGPFVGSAGSIGLYVLAGMPPDEARALVEQDPMVREGYARVEMMEWYVADETVPLSGGGTSPDPAPRGSRP